MKLIISQDGQQVFTCGDCQIYSLSTVEIPSEKEGEVSIYYSVGVAGISFGHFREIERAEAILKEIVTFLGGKDTSYTVPEDEKPDIKPKTPKK